MSKKSEQAASELRNFIRGGQIFLHNFRMFSQIGGRVFLVAMVIFILFCITSYWVSTDEHERHVVNEALWSSVITPIDSNATLTFKYATGEVATLKRLTFLHSDYVKKVTRAIATRMILAILIASVFAALSFWVLSRFLTKKGQMHLKSKHISGDRFAEMDEVKKLLKKNKAKGLYLGELRLPDSVENVHFLLHGTPGSGKSTVIRQMLHQIRRRGDKALIYDKGCNFVEEFYYPNHDVLLNPLDKRCRDWSLWAECRDSADFDSMAAAQIPMPQGTQDPFWVNAARTIFATAAFQMRNDKDRSVLKLLRYLLTADLTQLQSYLKGTEAETLMSERAEKTAISIKAVLATYLKSLKYVKEGHDLFSIRDWIRNDEANNWLFITSLGDRHESLKPLISTWLDIAVNSLLSLNTQHNRRIWIILDELASLQQLPYLTQTLSEARKFGGCMVLGVQNFAQLAKLYGQNGALEISALANTRLLFRQPDPDMARWSASNLGEAFMEEVREGQSYGASIMRDGVSINRVEVRKPVVSPSQILNLPDLQAYIRLPGAYPITRLTFDYKPKTHHNAAFILRDFDNPEVKKIDGIIEECEKAVFPPKSKVTTAEKKQMSDDKLASLWGEPPSLQAIDV